MKKLINHIFNTKPLSMFISYLILFIYLATGRIYIFNNINTSTNMIRLGAEWLNISLLSSILFILGVVIGAAAAFLLRTKATPLAINLLHFFSGLIVFITLLLTPYNLQLLLPTQNLQNISSIALIAVLVFQTIGVGILTLTLGTHCIRLARSNFHCLTSSFIIAATTIVLTVLTVVLQWSFTATVGICAIVLTLINVAHALFPLNLEQLLCKDEGNAFYKKKLITLIGLLSICMLAMILLGYFYAESILK